MPAPLLVLDLDETLIYATAVAGPCDFRLGSRCITIRPGAAEFLREARRHFRLAVWTARTAAYAHRVLKKLLPPNTPLTFVWSVAECHRAIDSTGRERWFKDLERLRIAGFPLEAVAVLDDAPEALISREARVLAIEPYGGSADDEALNGWTRRLAEVAWSLR